MSDRSLRKTFPSPCGRGLRVCPLPLREREYKVSSIYSLDAKHRGQLLLRKTDKREHDPEADPYDYTT
jgi:hypothetical protein